MKAIKCDLNKSIINLGFFGAAFVTMLLCFTASVYTDTTDSRTYSLFESITTLDKETILSYREFASVNVLRNGLTGYVSMFIPIITAFPFMMTFCAERNSGLMRFTITRTGKFRYYFSKFTAAFVSGGLAVMLGTALFGIFAYAFFPHISTYDISPEEMKFFLPDGEVLTVFRTLVSAFFYGAVSVMPAFFICSFCKNPYLITCLPFLFDYVRTTAISKAVTNGFAHGDFEVFDRLSPFNPDSITVISWFDEFNDKVKMTFIFNAAYVLILFLGFVLIMNCRTDKGA